MARRRRISGTPLLVAGSGVAVSVACSGWLGPNGIRDTYGPVGNLMAPPSVEVCVDVLPAEADARITIGDVATDRCASMYDGDVARIHVEAPGFEPVDKEEAVRFDNDPLTVTVTLTPEAPGE